MINDRDDEIEKCNDKILDLQNELRKQKLMQEMKISEFEQIIRNKEDKYNMKLKDIKELKESYDR